MNEAVVTEADREKAEVVADASEYRGRMVLVKAIAAALAEARQEGRDSVGLGDFMPDPCDEEKAAPNWHFVETYGDWLPCTLGRGHHEHEESGLTWGSAAEESQ